MKKVTVTGYVVVEVSVELEVPENSDDGTILEILDDRIHDVVNTHSEYCVEYEFQRKGSWYYGNYPAYEIENK